VVFDSGCAPPLWHPGRLVMSVLVCTFVQTMTIDNNYCNNMSKFFLVSNDSQVINYFIFGAGVSSISFSFLLMYCT
jgi:hypothetical protein